MRTSTTPRLTAAHAEHLLDGGRGTGPLPLLLAAATRAGAAHELAGEGAARTAFATAQLDRPPPPLALRSPPMPRTLLSRILAAKALAVLALAAGTTGGVALAAGTTVESGQVRHVDPASAGPSGSLAVDDADEPSPSTAPPTTRAAATARSHVAGSAEAEGDETGSGNDHCRAVAAGLPSVSPAPLPPGADNEHSAAAEHACAVAAPGRTEDNGGDNNGDNNGGDNNGNGNGKGRSAIRTTPPVPLPGLTNDN